MSFEAIKKSVRSRTLKPIYFFHGEESYFIDQLVELFENELLDESEKAFDQMTLYGKDTDAISIINNIRRMPMVSPINLVIVKEAQSLKTIADLVHYVQDPVQRNVLVIAHKHKKFDKRKKKLWKALEKEAVIFESKPIREHEVGSWIHRYLRSKKYEVSEEAVMLLSEYLGTNLGHIANELNKLLVNSSKGTMITPDVIERNIGINRTYNVFELNKAIGERKKAKALRIVQYFDRNPKAGPLPLVIPNLFRHFQKIFTFHNYKNLNDKTLSAKMGMRNSYFLKDYKLAAMHYPAGHCKRVIQILLQYDLKAKGHGNDGATQGELMKEMLIKILN